MLWRPLPLKTFTWVNLLAFKVIWLLLVLFQDRFVLPVLAITVCLLVIYPEKKAAWRYCCFIALPGIFIDLTLSLAGFFKFPDLFIPIWLMVLWINFALTLPYGFGFIKGFRLPIQAGIGAIGSFSYLIGRQLGAVEYPYPVLLTQGLLAILWACLLPVMFLVIRQIQHVRTYA